MIDFHIHSNTSNDCKFSASEMIKSAKKKGMTHIAITNHHEPFELMNKKPDYSLDKEKIERFKTEVLAEKNIFVGFGTEMGYYDEHEDYIIKWLKEHSWDYVLGSVHYVDGLCVATDKSKGKSEEVIRKDYFPALRKAIASGLFDMMSHLDIYKRSCQEITFEETKEEWQRVADLMIKHDVGFEVNTSYSKIVPGGTFPDKEIIKLLVEKGVKKITLGSDSHQPERIGTNFEEVITFLHSLGVKEIYRFEKRKPIRVPITEL